LERFKLIKEAYSVLKDPQKRYIYDSGITSEGVDPSAYNPVPQSPSHKYYENKWHGFTKNNYPDQRDEYDEEKVLYSQDINEVYSRPGYRLMAIAILGAAVVGYGYLGWRRSRAEIELEHSRGILEATVDDKQSRRMKRYIEERAKANRV
jgi:curved DNA-binding protein CbpA